MLKFCLLIFGALLLAAAAAPQTPETAVEDPGLIITTESTLVVVPLHVYRKKSSVNGLGPDAFEVLEDGVRQDIAFVEGPPSEGESSEERTVPTEVIFLIDFSYSVMTPGLLDFTTIKSAMLDGLRKDVEISVYGFAHSLKRFTGPTRDMAKLQRALDQTFESEAGGSRVYEAMMQTARDASSRGSNVSRMMVVFSDGLSTTNLNPELVSQVANVYGIPIYPVVLGHDRIARRAQTGTGGGFGGRPNHGGQGAAQRVEQGGEPQFGPKRNPSQSLNQQTNARAQENLQRIFAELGPKTGGRSYDPDVINNKVIRQILGSLSTLAQTEYVVGYYPKSVDEERSPHAVEVRLAEGTPGQLFGGRRLVVH